MDGGISDETVRRTLKNWTGALAASALVHPRREPGFVAAMEDVLDLYAESYDPEYPVVGFDERPLQPIAETRTPLPAQPGLPQRYDYEYRRNGTGTCSSPLNCVRDGATSR